MTNADTPRIEGWPIVEVAYPSQVAIPELCHVMDAIDRLLERGEPFAVVHQTTSTLDGAARRYAADRARGSADARSRHLVAEAVVTSSPLVRGVLSVVVWLGPHPNPIQAFDDLEAAREWCGGRMREGVRVRGS
ncbi:MAG: hypothetical protein U0230_17760 [Polyangiales bacterium]